ncbi:S-adenosyl-L-methionine-dependent methyltransferase [Podospora didyma]|uniref:S-adenosyl-L-methionine-dependent methyltransferase n=1 Tax=Podospora didyma TaxID=330526 RepID=A0AAE0P5K9_9PEZI|nr:S-adenosyl-L-methionine-dependent methyltransferase [Podospora didyma]
MADVAAQLEALAQTLTTAAKGLREGTLSLQGNEAERTKLTKAAKDVIGALELPHDTMMSWVPALTQITAVRLFNKWKVFESIPLEPGATISYKDLAAKVGADVLLITRLAWVLVGTGILKQVGADQVAHTAKSPVYIGFNPITAMTRLIFDDNIPAFVAMVKYFDQFGLKEPTGKLDTVTAFSVNKLGQTAYDVMLGDPDRTANFMMAMTALEHEYPYLGSYDLSWAVPSAVAEDNGKRPLVVDVGGGKGQTIKAVVKATPGLPVSRCVVEDLPNVAEEAKTINDPELAGVTFLGMDFHDEQPVKGALVYIIRRCLHNYGDDECVLILQKITNAMAPDSRLLIIEQVMTNPPNEYAAGFDIFMSVIGGKERTYEIFEDITSRAGLKILQLARNPGTDAALIECVKA